VTLMGCEEPRIFTPPLRELTPETSLGFSVVVFAESVLGMRLFLWQKWLLVHMLELREDGRLRFRTVVVLVARQNGKSTISVVLALWALYVLGVKTVLGTAQDLDTAEEVWETAVDLVYEVDDDDNPVRPELLALAARSPVRVNGKKALVLKGRRRYKVKAANRRAGRGLTGDIVLLDELREHQSWDAWSAISKTTTARVNALVVCLSNAGDITSVVLRHLRKVAHAALGDPDGINELDFDVDVDSVPDDASELVDDLGIFEWSAPPGCSVWDRQAWAQANPSLGYSIDVSVLASGARTDPEWVFRTEVLCQWADGLIVGPFPAGAWEKCAATRDEGGHLEPGERIVRDATTCAAVSTSWNRSRSYVAVAGFRPDGRPQVEIAAQQVGDEWVTAWFMDEARQWRRTWEVAVEARSEASTAALALKTAGLRVVDVPPAEMKVAWGLMYDAVRDLRVRHVSQPVLDAPAGSAIVRDQVVIVRKAINGDPAALVAAMEALWLLLRPRTAKTTTAAPPRKASSQRARHPMATAGF